jgi:hypothetical protein
VGSEAIGGFLHSPAKFAGTAAKEKTAKEHGRQLKEAAANQRHRIRQRLVTVAWRNFHETNSRACHTPKVRF